MDPKLVLGWSTMSMAGMPIVEMMPLTAKRNCEGTSTLMTGPAAKLKKLGRHAVSLGVAGKLGSPSVNSARHFCACIGACAPETISREGGVRKLLHLSCSRR